MEGPRTGPGVRGAEGACHLVFLPDRAAPRFFVWGAGAVASPLSAGGTPEKACLLDETLVIWGGEFGRTVYSQGALTRANYGRDHHPRNFCMWLAGGGIKGGMTYGETDDFSYNIEDKPCQLLDLYATVLKCLGVDHERLSFRFQGLDQKLTGVEGAQAIPELMA